MSTSKDAYKNKDLPSKKRTFLIKFGNFLAVFTPELM